LPSKLSNKGVAALRRLIDDFVRLEDDIVVVAVAYVVVIVFYVNVSVVSVSKLTFLDERKMGAADTKSLRGKTFYFFIMVKLTLVFACFAMFFLLMSDVFYKYRNRFTNTAIRLDLPQATTYTILA